MSRFTVRSTPIAGVLVLERSRIGDERGSFSRLFCPDELAAAGWHGSVHQINHSSTAREGTARGMHFQNPPHAEDKLVTCLRGAIWDVAVDLRQGSPTFLQHVGAELSDDNHASLLIPKGCAHGFQTLSDGVEMIYVHSAPYQAAAERGFCPTDPALNIAWPKPIT